MSIRIICYDLLRHFPRPMKTTLIPILALALALAAAPLSRADEVHDLLDKLNVEITKTLEEHKNDKKKHVQFEQLGRDMETLQKDFARDTFNAVEAARVLGQLAKNSQASAEA